MAMAGQLYKRDEHVILRGYQLDRARFDCLFDSQSQSLGSMVRVRSLELRGKRRKERKVEGARLAKVYDFRCCKKVF